MPKKSDYQFSNKAFANRITANNRVVYRVKINSIQDIAQEGIDSLNDTCTDSAVEDGYLLEDLSYTAKSVTKNGEIVVEVNADATSWMQDHVCPHCQKVYRKAMITVGKCIEERKVCTKGCEGSEE